MGHPGACLAQAVAAEDLPRQTVAAFDRVFGGPHPASRAVHAKGMMAHGSFIPHRNAARLSRASLSFAAAAILSPVLAYAVAPLKVTQEGRQFSERALSLIPGAVVRFVNNDDFPHQVRVSGPGMLYDSELQEFGQATDVTFATGGLFEVRCGVHPRMRMSVQVADRP